MTQAPRSLTLWLGGVPMLTFVDPPSGVQGFLMEEYGRLLEPGPGADVRVNYGCEPQHAPRVVLQFCGMRTAADPAGRFLLMDGHGRTAELPATGEERELWVDPDICTARNDATHQHVLRLLEWRLARYGMVMLKGGAVTLPQGTLAVSGFDGSGKTSTVLALLDHADGYLGEERLVLSSPATISAFPTPIKLSVGRAYLLPQRARVTLTRQQRRLLSLQRLFSPLPDSVGGGVRRVLADRWVSLDPLRAFPHLSVPATAALDSLVFLLPRDGGEVALEQLERGETLALARQQVACFDHQLLPLRVMFGYAFPGRTPWPESAAEVPLRHLPDLLSGVVAWALRYPRGAPATQIAEAVRSTLPGQRVPR